MKGRRYELRAQGLVQSEFTRIILVSRFERGLQLGKRVTNSLVIT
jgi:hypothetical protein